MKGWWMFWGRHVAKAILERNLMCEKLKRMWLTQGKGGVTDSEAGWTDRSQITQNVLKHIWSWGKTFQHLKQVCDMIKSISEKSLSLHYIKQSRVG